MSYAIAVILTALWLLVITTPYTKGGMIHVLPVIAIVGIVLRLMRRHSVWATKEQIGGSGFEGNKGIATQHGLSFHPTKEKLL